MQTPQQKSDVTISFFTAIIGIFFFGVACGGVLAENFSLKQMGVIMVLAGTIGGLGLYYYGYFSGKSQD